MSVLQTAEKHNLNALAYLRYHLDACAKSGGPPPDLEKFLPWNIPDEIIREYGMARGRDHPANFPLTICDRSLNLCDIELIRQIILSDPTASRVQISREVCQAWSWFKPDGDLKDTSCRVLLLRLHRLGLIALPAPAGQV
ncbi:MAG TPA: transposase domain-containing protein [Desulfotomaculum sp.]|nr:transposase domain-containing protein [Desulfotomaculum sp.]